MKKIFALTLLCMGLTGCTGHYGTGYYNTASYPTYYQAQPVQHVWVKKPRYRYVKAPKYYTHKQHVNQVTVHNSTVHHQHTAAMPANIYIQQPPQVQAPAPIAVAPVYSQEDRDMQQAIANSYQTYAAEQAARGVAVETRD